MANKLRLAVTLAVAFRLGTRKKGRLSLSLSLSQMFRKFLGEAKLTIELILLIDFMINEEPSFPASLPRLAGGDCGPLHKHWPAQSALFRVADGACPAWAWRANPN